MKNRNQTKTSASKPAKLDMINKVSDCLKRSKQKNIKHETMLLNLAKEYGHNTYDAFVSYLKSEFGIILEKISNPSVHIESFSYVISDEITKQKYYSTKDRVLPASIKPGSFKHFKIIDQSISYTLKRKQETPDDQPAKKMKTANESIQEKELKRNKLISDFISFSEQCKLLNLNYHDEFKKFVTITYQLDAPSYIKTLSDHDLSLKITDSSTEKEVTLKSLKDNSIIKQYSLTKITRGDTVKWQLYDDSYRHTETEQVTSQHNQRDDLFDYLLPASFKDTMFSPEHREFTFFGGNSSPYVPPYNEQNQTDEFDFQFQDTEKNNDDLFSL